MKMNFNFFVLVFNHVNIKTYLNTEGVPKKKILVAKYFRALIKHCIHVISYYLPKQNKFKKPPYICIYIYLSYLHWSFFFFWLDMRNKIKCQCWLYFFINNNVGLFSFNVDCSIFIIYSQKAKKYLLNRFLPGNSCFKVKTLPKWHYGITGIQFFFFSSLSVLHYYFFFS